MDRTEGINSRFEALNADKRADFWKEYNVPVEKLEGLISGACGVYETSGYEMLHFSGMATIGIESLVSSCVPVSRSIAVINNSSHGSFIKRIAAINKVHYFEFLLETQQMPDLELLEAFLLNHPSISYVVLPLISIAGHEKALMQLSQVLDKLEIGLLVDYYGKLEGFNLNLNKYHIDCLSLTPADFRFGTLSSSVLVAHRRFLSKCEGNANSYSLDLYSVWQNKIWNKSDLAV